MKTALFLITVVFFWSCTAGPKVIQNYYYVEPFKEQEIMLVLKHDSTFNLQDVVGCNQFQLTGHYKKGYNNLGQYFIFDSVRLQNVLSKFNAELIFSIKDRDTAWIINEERIFIDKKPFAKTSKRNINLQEIRYKKLERYYTDLLGRKGFVEIFGNGKGIKEAKKRILDCKLPDIIFNYQ